MIKWTDPVGVTADNVAPIIQKITITIETLIGTVETQIAPKFQNKTQIHECFEDLKVALICEIAEKFGERQLEIHPEPTNLKRGRKPRQ